MTTHGRIAELEAEVGHLRAVIEDVIRALDREIQVGGPVPITPDEVRALVRPAFDEDQA